MRIISVIGVALLAVVVTLVTGFWAPYSMFQSGFPLSWETRNCVAILNLMGGYGCTPVAYDWVAFALDLVFFSIATYGVLLAFTKYRCRTR